MSADDPTPAELAPWRRALAALPPAERAMVQRLARVLQLAAEQPLPRRRPALIPSVATDDAADGAENDPPDEVAAAHARRILARHGRRDGAA